MSRRIATRDQRRTMVAAEKVAAALAGIPELHPLWCTEHEQRQVECEFDEFDCDPDEYVERPGTFLTEFVLLLNFMDEDGEMSIREVSPPSQPLSHSVGLMRMAEKLLLQ